MPTSWLTEAMWIKKEVFRPDTLPEYRDSGLVIEAPYESCGDGYRQSNDSLLIQAPNGQDLFEIAIVGNELVIIHYRKEDSDARGPLS